MAFLDARAAFYATPHPKAHFGYFDSFTTRMAGGCCVYARGRVYHAAGRTNGRSRFY